MADMNPDQFREISTQGWLSRIGNSFVGILVGLVLILAAIALLSWNENRAVTALNAIKRGAGSIVDVVATNIDPKNNQKLVYVSGPLVTDAPTVDPQTGVTLPNVLRLDRKVEMYQWQERMTERKSNNVGGSQTTEKVYDYALVWTTDPQNSANFKVPAGHLNSQLPLTSKVFDATKAKLGAFTLDTTLLNKLNNYEPVNNLGQAPAGYQLSGASFYKGSNPQQPQLGDVRITYLAITGQTYSIAAQQNGESLTAYKDPSNGYVIAIVEPGSVPSNQLFADQKKSEGLITWGLRLLGFVAMFIGFKLLFGPLEMLAAVLPFLESLVGFGTGLIAFGLALPVTLLTIAVAWIASRPLIGAGLLIAAVGIAVAIRFLAKKSPDLNAAKT